jgi:hypothetical protein
MARHSTPLQGSYKGGFRKPRALPWAETLLPLRGEAVEDAHDKKRCWIGVSNASLCLLILASFLLPGCVRLGERWQPGKLPADAPEVSIILDDLTKHAQRVKQFKATGHFIFESPMLKAIQSLPSSTVWFRAPADLHVVAGKYGAKVFRLTCLEDQYLMEFPTEHEYFFQEGIRQWPGLEFDLDLSDVVRELLFIEDWSHLSPKRVRLMDYNPTTQEAELLIRSKGLLKRPERRLLLKGKPWVLIQSERLDLDTGEVLAITKHTDYRDFEGLLFPEHIETRFPLEESSMRFSFRKFLPNEAIEDSRFDISSKLSEIQNWTRLDPPDLGRETP